MADPLFVHLILYNTLLKNFESIKFVS